MIGSPRRVERVGALRVRLIASILVASLMPFFAAWWIANAYVADQARSNADVRLTFSARSAAREASALLATTRARALELARMPKLQRAARRGDRLAVVRLLKCGPWHRGGWDPIPERGAANELCGDAGEPPTDSSAADHAGGGPGLRVESETRV